MHQMHRFQSNKYCFFFYSIQNFSMCEPVAIVLLKTEIVPQTSQITKLPPQRIKLIHGNDFAHVEDHWFRVQFRGLGLWITSKCSAV